MAPGVFDEKSVCEFGISVTLPFSIFAQLPQLRSDVVCSDFVYVSRGLPLGDERAQVCFEAEEGRRHGHQKRHGTD